MMNAIRTLWQSMRALKGNQRACVVSEPLWAVPYQLFLPFASLYMAAIGLSDAQIGTLASLTLAMQLLWGLLSGAIVDKYGRCKTMLVFGLLSWTIPCALWALAQGYWYFAFAIMLNSMWRVTGNSYSCLIVEEGDITKLVNIYTIMSMMGLLAGFLSPVAGFFIARFTLVPTMRVLYAIALVLMTTKFILQYRLSRETEIGKQRIAQSKGRSLFSLAFGGWPAFQAALKERRMRLCVLMMILLTCFNTIQASFWPLFISTHYRVSDSLLSVFPLVKAAVTLVVYLFISPRIKLIKVRSPLLAGLGAQWLGLVFLLAMLPFAGTSMWAVFLSAACDAVALAVLTPVTESLMSLSVPPQERARINSLVFAAILLASIPAGWLAGQLSELSRIYPLVINLVLVLAEAFVALRISSASKTAALEES